MLNVAHPRAAWRLVCVVLLVSLGLVSQPVYAGNGSRSFSTIAEFANCTGGATPGYTNTSISEDGDGEIALRAGFEDYFRNTSALSSQWQLGVYTLGGIGGTPAVQVANGELQVSSTVGSNLVGSYVYAKPVQRYGQIEGEVTFSKGWFQHVGLATPGFSDVFRFAIFSTGEDKLDQFNENTLYARTNNNVFEIKTALGPIPTGPVRLRILWQNEGGVDVVRYSRYENGNWREVAVHSLNSYPLGQRVFSQPMYLHVSNKSAAATAGSQSVSSVLKARWLRVTPYQAASGSYLSCPISVAVNQRQKWGPVTFSTLAAAGGSLQLDARTSDDGINWSAFAPIASSGSTPALAPGVYFQYRVRINASNNKLAAPKLAALGVSYTNQGNPPPGITPASGPAGTKFLVRGDGFSANTALQVKLDGWAVPGSVTTSSVGTFAFYLDSTALAFGQHSLLVSGNGRSPLQFTFGVTSGTPGSPPPGGVETLTATGRTFVPAVYHP